MQPSENRRVEAVRVVDLFLDATLASTRPHPIDVFIALQMDRSSPAHKAQS